ncbi:MAG: exosortase [Parvularculaceae bacterium]|nr:exosortase [Parvularculaceae bacterium]
MRALAFRNEFTAAVIRCWPAITLSLAALVLYMPIYADFYQGAWRRDENSHAIIVMAIAIGAAGVRLSTERFDQRPTHVQTFAGCLLLFAGVAMAIAGRLGEADLLSSASQALVAGGASLAILGVQGVKRLWFPLAMTFYLIVWPGWALDALTGPLKNFVSRIVSDGLYAVGLPVAHSGAVISAGPYQLLVADACSGLNSLIALTAVGAVYLYAVRHGDWRVNAGVLAALIPIAIIANVMRVAALVLITYFLGYDAGQGFMHDGAGLMMFAIALGLVFAVDASAIALAQRRAK